MAVQTPAPAVPADVRQNGAPGTQSSGWAKGLRYALLILFAALVLLPLYVLIVTSLKDRGDISPATAWSLPTSPSLTGWQAAVERLAPAMGRTLIMAVVAAVLSSILGSMNGFVFARWRFPGAQTVFTLFLFGMFIPYQAVMIPLQSMMIDVEQALPWFNGVAKLIAVHTISASRSAR